MTEDKYLLAYIVKEGETPFVDIVEISKKGSSYLYNNERWHKELPTLSGECKNELGNKIKIIPLSRNHDPFEAIDDEMVIQERAVERYQKWKAGEL